MSDFFKDGSRWGSIDSSGSIYASDGTYLGSLDKFGKFHDSSGTYMGSIDSQGKIRNYKGDYLGSVWSNGEVHNDRGDYIGMFPYYNGKIGQFQIGNNNDSASSNNNSDYNNGNQTTGSSTTHTSTGGGSITPASLSSEGDILDVIKFVVIIIIGALIFSILSDCFYTVKELFISPYSSILLLLSLVAPAIAGTISKKENAAKEFPLLYLINYALCLLWSIIFTLILQMTAVYSVFIFALDSVIFALAMTIISILFYTILDKIIFSNKNMDDFNWLIALLSLSIITCVLVIILFVQNLFQLDHRLQWDKRPCSYAPYESTTEYTDEDTESYDNTDDSDDFSDDSETYSDDSSDDSWNDSSDSSNENNNEESSWDSISFEDKINQIKTDYYDIENNLDSMESDSGDGATFYYRNNTLTKMVDTVYQDNYTVEVSYKNSKPFFIFMKSNDDNSEYRYYYFNGKLIRYIDENGEVSDYEEGTDLIDSDLYEWADAM